MRLVALCVFSICLMALSGCQLGFGGVEVKAVNSSVQKPSNVALYVAVSDAGTPLTDLDESNFQVFENGQVLDKAQTQLTLLERERVALHHLLLLVDLSGKLETTELEILQRALEGFVESATKHQSVSLFGYDGSSKIWSLGEFDKGHQGDIAFSNLKGGDPSRNLHGAVKSALAELAAQLMRVKRPVRIGTLVVFARGPDVAGREPLESVEAALEEVPYDVFSVGMEAEDTSYLDGIGRSGNIKTPSLSSIGQAFEETASRVNEAFSRYYLVQYCSPARAGTPTLRLRVHYTTKEGEEHDGELELGFDAGGFGPGCNPSANPSFKVQLADPWDMQSEGDAESEAQPAKKPNAPSAPSSKAGGGAEDGAPADTGPGSDTPDEADDDDNIVPPPDKPGYE